MPTYQYRCTECGHDLEAVQKFTDAALTECPQCGGTLRKVYNAVGVVFKGSGFYRTDSRKAPSEGSSDGGSGSNDGAGSGTKKSDGKDAGAGKSAAPAKESSTPAATPSSSSSSTAGKAAAS